MERQSCPNSCTAGTHEAGPLPEWSDQPCFLFGRSNAATVSVRHPGPNRASSSRASDDVLRTHVHLRRPARSARVLLSRTQRAASRARRARPAPRAGSSRAPCRRRPPRTPLRVPHGRARRAARHRLNRGWSRIGRSRTVPAGAPQRLRPAPQGCRAEFQAAFEARALRLKQCASRLLSGP
jgi:hypothetical protein